MPIRLDNPHCPEAVAHGAQGSLDFFRPEWLAKFGPLEFTLIGMSTPSPEGRT